MNSLVPTLAGHPILGALLDFRSDRVGFLTDVSERYGDIARGRFGLFPIVVVSSAELAHEVLVEHSDAFVKGYGLSVFARPLLGEGLLTSEREVHRRQRRLVAPAFMHKRIAGYATSIAALTDRAIEGLEDGATIDVAKVTMQLTFEIVGRTLFNADISGDARDVGEALTAAMEHFVRSLSAVVPVPPSWPTPGNRRTRKIIGRLDEVVYRLIRERRASGIDEGDFLSMLLLAQDEEDGSIMTDKQVRDEAMTILLAGHETTANALAWASWLVAKHPDVRVRMEQEVDAVLGRRTPTLADLPTLPYTLAVFKEAMRLYPPAYLVTRRATRDVVIGPHRVRKNEVVIIDIVGMHRRTKYFERPLEFDPDRFAPEKEKAMTKHAFLPFGGGPRVCIGNHFALMEGHVILAMLAQRLRFELLSGCTDVETEPLITLRPKGGIPVRVRHRHPPLAARSVA